MRLRPRVARKAPVEPPGTPSSAPPHWSRRRAQAALLGSLALLVAIIVGTALRVATGPETPDPHAHRPRTGALVDPADQLAAAPLPSAGLDQALPGPLTTALTPPIQLPTASALGPAGVAAGYPQTAAGALAQLAAIDIAALGSGSITRAQQIIAAWAGPGGPTPESWSGVRAVAALLSGAGLSADGDPRLSVQVTAPMGLIKGSIGTDFVVPCLDLLVTVTLGGHRQAAAVADCQRMVWRTGRWVIGAGAEPATAPSVWPGTQAAVEAGYAPLLPAAEISSEWRQ